MRTELIRSFSSAKISSLTSLPSSSSFTSLNNLSVTQSGYNSDYNLNEPQPSDDEKSGCLQSWFRSTFRKKIFLRFLPILTWLPEYTASKAIADTIAAITVALTLLPQGLAYSGIAGLPPQYGLYSAFIGCFIYIFFGGCPSVTIGPTAIMAIMTFTYGQGKPPEYTILLTFLTGIVNLLMGIFQIGFITCFISTPVLSAFTSAASLTIASTQLKALFGLKFKASGFVHIVIGTLRHIEELKPNDTLLSLVCIVFLLFFQKLQVIFKFCTKSLPAVDKFLWFISTSRSAILIIVVTGIFSYLGDPPAVDIVGNLVEGLPPFQLPPFVFSANNSEGVEVEFSIKQILAKDTSAIIVLPLLALMEHITIAKAFAGSSRVDASQEMISIGLSNLIGSFFSSIPVTGSFSRSSVNKASGAVSPMGGLITGVLVILALAFLTPYFYYIPQAALASVIVCAVIFMVDLQIIIPLWKSKRMDLIPWSATFLVSLLIGLEFGILVGFGISVIFLLYNAARPSVRVKRGFTSFGTEFILVDLDRSLTFPSMEYIRYIILKSGSTWGHNYLPIVVDFAHIQYADFTAAQGMKDLFKMFEEKSQDLILWNVKDSIIRVISGAMSGEVIEYKICKTEFELEETLREITFSKKNAGSKTSVTITHSEEEEEKGHYIERF